jgi:hypothetical protein
MNSKHSNDCRRKLLKSIAIGSGAGVAGNSLPKSWSRPVISSVLLPVHAATTIDAIEAVQAATTQPVEIIYSKTLGFDISAKQEIHLIPDQELSFALEGLVPKGDGTVTISKLAGDLSGGTSEVWAIEIGANTLGVTNHSPEDCEIASGTEFNVPHAILLEAISGDDIVITAINGGDIEDFCGEEGEGGSNNTMDVTLVFPALP